MPRRFHTPGHAGSSLCNTLPDALFRFDLSEVGDLDVLSEASGCIEAAQQRAAKIYNVRDSFFLINGASVGIIAAMLATLKPGDKVLLPRNTHRSVLSGLILTGAEPVWMLPDALPEWGIWGAVNTNSIDVILSEAKNLTQNIKALILTSPTYEGIGSDIEKISALCQQHGVLLIVDEAHGALWPFSNQLPTSAIDFDCDCVVQSLHKSGGSRTQSAVAHLPAHSRISRECYQQALNTLQSTSPSYLLLASLDASIQYLASSEGQQRIETLLKNTQCLREKLDTLTQFKLFKHASHFDPTKLYLTHPQQAGSTWGDRVEYDYGMPYESASPYGVLYLANIGLQVDDFEYFFNTLQTINIDSVQQPAESIPAWHDVNQLPIMASTPRDAFFAEGETITRQNAVGRISKESIVHCPPGVPVLMPGEVIAEHHLAQLPAKILVLR